MKSMKTTIVQCCFVLTSFFATGNLLHAQVMPESSIHSEMDGKIKFVGKEDEMLVFHAQLENLHGKDAVISILDDNGNTLFEEKISTSSFLRKYKIVLQDIGKLTFRISGKQILYNQTFTINYRLEEKLEVKKAD